jgi:hypothetical protein
MIIPFPEALSNFLKTCLEIKKCRKLKSYENLFGIGGRNWSRTCDFLSRELSGKELESGEFTQFYT